MKAKLFDKKVESSSKIKEIFFNFKYFYEILDRDLKRKFWISLALVILSSFLEAIFIASLFPFIKVLSRDEVFISKIYDFFPTFNNLGETSLVLYIVFFLWIFSASSSLIKIFNLRYSSYAAASITNDLSKKAFKAILNRPYMDVKKSKSGNIIAIMIRAFDITEVSFIYIFELIVALISAIFISVVLLFVTPKEFCLVIFVILFSYLIINLKSKHIYIRSGEKYIKFGKSCSRIIKEAIDSFKYLLITRGNQLIQKEYGLADQKLRLNRAKVKLLGKIPKYIIEPITVVTLTFVALVDQSGNLFVKLGILLASFQKLIPNIQTIYRNLNLTKSNFQAFDDLVKLIKKNDLNYEDVENIKEKIYLEKEIRFENVSFNYLGKSDKKILSDLNLVLKKGQVVGIMGPSGSGKSTFVDMLLGLIKPLSGKIYIDDLDLYGSDLNNIYKWQNNISFVPQEIILMDKSVEANIAFGYETINRNLIQKVIRVVELENYVESLPNKYEQKLGEFGNFLSGGQRQRIGIARALYRRADLIIFDEATSSLDSEVENKIIKNIANEYDGITQLIISHKMNAFKYCDFIYNLKNNKLTLLSIDNIK